MGEYGRPPATGGAQCMGHRGGPGGVAQPLGAHAAPILGVST